MSTSSSSSPLGSMPNHRLSLIAERIRSQMRRLQISVTELARRCDTLAHEIFPDEERPNLTRERIAKIMMNAQTRIGKGAAKVVSQQEIFILARTLEVSAEWLSGQTRTNSSVLWDAASEPEVGKLITHLLAEYEERAGEMLVWGDNLLCSLTPPEFAHGYHQSLFAELDEIGLKREKQILVETYDRVGDARRLRTFGEAYKRNWTITQIIFLSELESISTGSGHYADIPLLTRRKCLENLLKILADDSLGVSLRVARDKDVPQIKHFLHDYDRLGVNGEQFSLWTYHSGKIAWTEQKDSVMRHRQIIRTLEKKSFFSSRKQVLELISRLLDQTNEK